MRIAVLSVLLVVTANAAGAQPPRATVTPLVESEAASGATTRLALSIALPEKLHVQSDRPRDPLLIPTVLTVENATNRLSGAVGLHRRRNHAARRVRNGSSSVWLQLDARSAGI
jgi:hypothetical protein